MAKVEDVIRVTTAPWAGQRGIVESVDGAYNIVRLDTSQHPDDVQELYPNEFVVLCPDCEHDKHESGKCEMLSFYTRGPNDPPGNQNCLCGMGLVVSHPSTNENAGWIRAKDSSSQAEIARQVVECWFEDCVDELLGPIPNLSPEQLKLLLHQVEVGVMRGGE